jgi:hypothetical protein
MYPKLKSVLVLAVSLMPIGVSAVSIQSASAATFAYANAEVNFSNFSHKPGSIAVLATPQASTISGGASAAAEEDALFCVAPDPKCAQTVAGNYSTSRARGTGSSDYYGFAQSQAEIAGYDFLIGAGETFSFNFDALLQVGTRTDRQPGERAFASSDISFQIFAGDTLLEQLILSGTAENANRKAELNVLTISPDGPSSFSFDSDIKYNVRRNTPAKISLVDGLFSRTFDRDTQISLVESKLTQAVVAVPEPTLLPALGVLIAVFGYRAYRQKTIKPLNLESGLKS